MAPQKLICDTIMNYNFVLNTTYDVTNLSHPDQRQGEIPNYK